MEYFPDMRVRWIGGIAVVAIGPNAAGKLFPPDVDLISFCAKNRRVVIDLAGCDPLSSVFLGRLIRAHQAAQVSRNGLRLCCPDGMARQLLSTVKLDRVMPVFPTLAEALEDFSPPDA